tara:strand:+ start:151 stop:411 length:261 start_codon:yes stop_codon:yes gene_type:complete
MANANITIACVPIKNNVHSMIKTTNKKFIHSKKEIDFHSLDLIVERVCLKLLKPKYKYVIERRLIAPNILWSFGLSIAGIAIRIKE